METKCVRELFEDMRMLFKAFGAAACSIQQEMVAANNETATTNDDEFIQKRGKARSFADVITDVGIRKIITTKYTAVALLSEENYDKARENDEYRLYLDPINGSLHYLQNGKDFEINGIFFHNNNPVFSISRRPGRDLEFYSIADEGVFENSVIGTTCLSLNKDSTSKIVLYNSKISPEELSPLIEQGYTIERTINDNVPCLRVINGEVAAFIGRNSKIWDVMVTGYFLQHLGGHVSDWNYNPIVFNQKVLPNFLAASNSETSLKIASCLSRLV